MLPDFQPLVDDFQADLGCPGVIMGLQAGQAEWYGAAGQFSRADLDRPFYTYSISKTFTAACILGLAQAGQLRLDQPFGLYLGQYGLPDGVTIRRLLNHTAGIPDYGSMLEYTSALIEHPQSPPDWTELLGLILAKGLSDPPGSRFRYSNTGYLLLSLLLEKLSGASFAQVLEQMIFDELGLEHTWVAKDLDREHAMLPGYADEAPFNGRDMRALYHPGWVAHGLVISTLREVNRFYLELFKPRFFAPALLKEMTQPVFAHVINPPFVTPSYCLGMTCDPDYPLGSTYGHGGGGPGYGIYAGYMPDLHGVPVVFCAMGNASLRDSPWHLWSRCMELIDRSRI